MTETLHVNGLPATSLEFPAVADPLTAFRNAKTELEHALGREKELERETFERGRQLAGLDARVRLGEMTRDAAKAFRAEHARKEEELYQVREEITTLEKTLPILDSVWRTANKAAKEQLCTKGYYMLDQAIADLGDALAAFDGPLSDVDAAIDLIKANGGQVDPKHGTYRQAVLDLIQLFSDKR